MESIDTDSTSTLPDDERAEQEPYQPSGLLQLPDSLLLKIFSNLSHTQLWQVATVCKKWLSLVLDTKLWQSVKFSQWNYLTEDQVIHIIRKQIPPTLRLVDLSNCRVSSLIFHELSARFQHLETLLLQNTNFVYDDNHDKDNGDSDDGNVKIKSFTLPSYLVRLDLRNFEADSQLLLPHIMVQVSYLRNLECLRCTGVAALQFEDFPTFKLYPSAEDFHLLGALRSLRILECVDCDAITDTHIALVVEQLSNLESLSLKNCENVTGSMLNKLLTSTAKLKSLNLSGTRLTDSAMTSAVWEKCRIEEIDLSYCSVLTEEGLLNSIWRIKDIRYLALNYVGKGRSVTEKLFEKSAKCKTWKYLTTLSVFVSNKLHCSALTSLRQYSHLCHISFRTCSGITFNDIAHNLEYFPNLSVLECGSPKIEESAARLSNTWIHLLESLSNHCRRLKQLVMLRCTALD